MTSREIREKFLKFFEERGHAVIPSASLVPENDPTTLFTGSGMQPLIPYLLGEKHPQGQRLADSQKCFRAIDIEEVGDNRHTTFFEMLGNWSLGDYFKREQLAWFFEFLTDVVRLDPDRLYVTVFSGEEKNNILKDSESADIWKELFVEKNIDAKVLELGTEAKGYDLGMRDGRIFYYDSSKNWWSRNGVPDEMPAGEPGGPDSEVFYDFGIPHNPKFGKNCHPNCDCGRFVEIGNSVFMEYRKMLDGTFEKLAQKNVDFGGGLERITAASNNNSDIFKIDLFQSSIEQIESVSSFRYGGEHDLSFRIVSDHIRGVAFMVSEGISPSNTERGYIVRRLIRRAVRHADLLGMKEDSLKDLIDGVAANYADVYPEIKLKEPEIKSQISREEMKFRKTLQKGLAELKKIQDFSGKSLFNVYSTYGIPLDISLEELVKSRKEIDRHAVSREFDEEFSAHRDISRTATAGTFKGGLADHTDEVVRLHTTTHLMQAALRKVLGDHIFQKGSNITKERTRFDFTHSDKMTDEQKEEVEKLVNGWIKRDLRVKKEIMSQQDARDLGAIGLFGEKYGEKVSIYTIYDPETQEIISREFCGGPHVEHTGEVNGAFKIQKEQSASAGVRRIKGVLYN